MKDRQLLSQFSLANRNRLLRIATFYNPNPREHPGSFIFYWVVCGWLAPTAIFAGGF
jgi:hypothetical protein